ncbi:CHAT domain-containing protein [Phormidesmis priestleyi]
MALCFCPDISGYVWIGHGNAFSGYFDSDRGFGSFVLLAPSTTALAPNSPPTFDQLLIPSLFDPDGLLTAEEISELNLNAELVVLSACNTGQGRLTGDGVIGLSRSFIAAGVPSVVVSLWSVPDAPTGFLMTKFYENLQRNPKDKAQALRQAMLSTMREQSSSPVSWAAFTLVGEAE